jgi:hypothetical protein
MTDAGLVQRRRGLVSDKILRRHQDATVARYDQTGGQF